MTTPTPGIRYGEYYAKYSLSIYTAKKPKILKFSGFFTTLWVSIIRGFVYII